MPGDRRGVGELSITMGGWLFLGIVISAGLGFVPVAWAIDPPTWATAPVLVYMAIYTQIAALLPIRWSRGSLQHVFTAPLVAAGLFSPGAGVAAIAWLALYDRRLPGRDIPVWRLLYMRSTAALTHGVGSLVAASIILPGPWRLPFQTLIYSLIIVCVNLPLTAAAFAAINQTSVVREIVDNAGWSTIRSILVLGFAGGILYLILQRPEGYLMAPALGGLLLAVRGNMASLQQQSEMRLQTLLLAGQALDARDSYTESHSTRVAELASRIAGVMHLSTKDVEAVRSAGLLHDIGKIGIPDSVLHKPGPLTASERELMNRHAALGADMISRHDALLHLAPLVRHHHERWDGSGYPAQLAGVAIPLGARILAVADSFDTMTGVRIYKSTKMSTREAADELAGLAGKWYDPDVIDAAMQVLHPKADSLPKRPFEKSEMPRRRPFWLLLIGATVSAVGDPLSTVALLVTVFQLSHSPLLVGMTYAAKAIATIGTTWLLGSIGDRWSRRLVIACVELSRAALIGLMPVAIGMGGVPAAIVVVILLAIGAALAGPARQAALAQVIDRADMARAVGAVAFATTVAQIGGFAVAGALLAMLVPLTMLFFIDAGTFLVAALLLVGTGFLGGGVSSIPLSAAFSAGRRLSAGRPYFLLAMATGLGVGCSYPTLLPFAYTLARNGATAYAVLEIALSLGVALGSFVAHRLIVGGGLRASVQALLLMGAASVALGLSKSLFVAVIFILAASVGSAIFVVANQEGLLRLAPSEHRSGIMATRFAIAQTSVVVGIGIGGVLTSIASPGATYVALGGYLVVVSLVFQMMRLASDASVVAEGAESLAG